MILVLVVALPIGWKARRAGVQRRAVAAVARLGGSVVYDWQDRAMKQNPRTMPEGPDVPSWVPDEVGNEYFQEVVGVAFPPNGGDWPRRAR